MTAPVTRSITLFSAICALLALGSCATLAVPAPNPSVPPLHFRTATCDVLALGPGSETTAIVRDYLVWPDRHSTRYTIFADTQCRRPLVTFQLSGLTFDRGPGPLPNTRAVDVRFDEVLLTAESPAALPMVQACGSRPWRVGVQQDVTETGCLFLKPRAACGVDHDILQISEDAMIPGFRTGDMCRPEGRPTRLQTAPALRVRD